MLSLAELLKLSASDSNEPQAPSCVCGQPVAAWRDQCPACKEARRRADRELLLAKAYGSLPAMPWAVWGALEGKASPAIVKAIASWKRQSGGLLISGPTGVGKTTAVVARVRHWLDTARDKQVPVDAFRFAARIRFTAAADIAIARKQYPLGGGESPVIESALAASLLVLDELGYESQQDTAVPELVDCRYRKGLPTITTTGLRWREVEKRYGEATARKLLGGALIVEVWS